MVASHTLCLIDAEFRARAAYAEPHRHYHGQQHLDECLAQVDQLHGLTDRERRLLRWAILWHDAIYDPHRTDNEEQSADLARRELLGCGIVEDADEVRRLILLTSSHSVEKSDRLGALLVSIDLSILGSEPDRYRAYVEGVRREYAHLPAGTWRDGRTAALQRLLAADPLYPDASYRARLEAQARRNLVDELRMLGGG